MQTPLPPLARRRLPGFTLLEVMLAIAIFGLVSITLYRFVDTTLRAAAFSEKSGQEDDALAGLRRLVAAQLAAMPINSSGALVGMTVEHDGVRRDAMQMVCPAGNAVLSPEARGYYQVTLDLEEKPRGSGHPALYLEREPWTEGEEEDVAGSETDKKSASVLPADVLKLMDGVEALEIAYFDARLNGWVDKWADPQALPNLVRLRLTTINRTQPYEMVLRVPGGGLTRVDSLPGVPNVVNGAFGTSANGLPPSAPSYVPPPPPSYVPQPPPNIRPPQPPPNLGTPLR